MASRNSPPSAVEIVLKLLGAIAGAMLVAFVLWGLRSLILPVAVGALVAYICDPLVVGLERYGVRRGLAIGLLLLAFVSGALLIAGLVRSKVPTEIGSLDFRTRVLHKINDRYRNLMGLDISPRGSQLYRLIQEDVESAMDRINRLLALTADERTRFLQAHTGKANLPSDSARLLDYDSDNVQTFVQRGLTPRSEGGPEDSVAGEPGPPRRPAKTPLAALAGILSTWVVEPTVFLFLLLHQGVIQRGLLSLVPNRLFEPT